MDNVFVLIIDNVFVLIIVIHFIVVFLLFVHISQNSYEDVIERIERENENYISLENYPDFEDHSHIVLHEDDFNLDGIFDETKLDCDWVEEGF